MLNRVKTSKLKEHHKNGHYFTDLEGEKYTEVRRSIEENGIRDPIKCTMDYTVFSGHQRLRIARDLGLEEVPVQIVDVDEHEAEYLLIAENVERRGQAESDPIKKSRIANFLREYWGVSQGKKGQNVLIKNIDDIGEILGESHKSTQRILKLNDLIPELQQLVSSKKLGTTAGEQLAYLSEENQKALLKALGDDMEKTTVQNAKDYRKESESEDFQQRLEEMGQLIIQKDNENKSLQEQLEQAENENVIEVVPDDYDAIKGMYSQLQKTEEWYKQENAELRSNMEKLTKQLKENQESPHSKDIESLQQISKLHEVNSSLGSIVGVISESKLAKNENMAQVLLDITIKLEEKVNILKKELNKGEDENE